MALPASLGPSGFSGFLRRITISKYKHIEVLL